MLLKHHNSTAICDQIESKSPAPTPRGAAFRAHLDFAKLPLRACLVSNRVGLGGAKSASPTWTTGTLQAAFRGQLPQFSKRFYQRELSDSPFACARIHKKI